MIYASFDEAEPQAVTADQLLAFLQLARASQTDSVGQEQYIAIYADSEVPYGKLVEILDLGARHGLKMVLATKPAPESARPAQ